MKNREEKDILARPSIFVGTPHITTVQYKICIKSPPCGSSDLIYKIEKGKKEKKKTNLQI